jgi:hypothetical protein
MDDLQLVIKQALDAVQKFVEDRDYKGYDPADGLTSWLRPLTFDNLFAERVLQQAIWKCPFNIRPLLGVRPMDSTKGRGFMAWGYLLMFKTLGDEEYRSKAIQCLDWLDENRETGYAGHCWGNHFDFSSRTGRIAAHEPTIVWTSLIGQAFLEAYEQTGNRKFLQIARSICTWILGLPREVTSHGCCLSYVPNDQSSIHNSNMLGAAMLARTWRHSQEPEYMEVARAAMLYSCSHQREDGSWYYGEAPMHHWIDSFHTAYNLDSLKRYNECTGDESFRDNLTRGFRYFRDVFFEDTGRPRYYHNSTYPIDIQCASQAIDTLSYFGAEDRSAVELAGRVAMWTIKNMQDRSGYFYYRRYPLITAKTPYFHWGQATMYKGLAHLLSRLRKQDAIPLAKCTQDAVA